MKPKSRDRKILMVIAGMLCIPWLFAQTAEKKALTFQDIMRFREIRSPAISENGQWVAYATQPDRGDGDVRVFSRASGETLIIERGSRPVISTNSRWVAAILKPAAVDMEGPEKKKLKDGLALLDTRSGDIRRMERVQGFRFSDDSRWLAVLHHAEDEGTAKAESAEPKPKESPARGKEPPELKHIGNLLSVYDLETQADIQIPRVLEYAFDGSSRYLVYVIAEPDGANNGLYYEELTREGWSRRTLLKKPAVHISRLAWVDTGGRLAFAAGSMPKDKDQETQDVSLWIWDSSDDDLCQAVTPGDAPPDWYLPEKNQLRWSEDGSRLFFGFKPLEFKTKTEAQETRAEDTDLFDTEAILRESEVDVWHWNDPYINTHQKNIWPQVKDRTFTAVLHTATGTVVSLADTGMPDVQWNENPDTALGFADAAYRKMVTWHGRIHDLYLINLHDGSRRLVAERLEGRPALSPNGGYVVYYRDNHWHVYDRAGDSVRNLTYNLDAPFHDEDHDYPQKAPGYGVAGWVEKDRAVLIYDKYDIWMFPLPEGEPVSITGGAGRKQGLTYRVLRMDPDQDYYRSNQELLLSSYHNPGKYWGFASCRIDRSGVSSLVSERKKFRFLAKAKKAESLIYTRESYEEFPDLWISDGSFRSREKISEVNPQIEEFAWGTAELVEWESADGIPLQGVLIKPGNYRPGRRYPVIVYFYRFFSQRLYEFNQTVINHRPHFPFYASNGYAVFLPDIRFQVGLPGFSATKCLVPGVQKLIDMGIADPDAVGLHGHSWSGYQTAFVITQSDLFKCAVAGAPVSNMTSAYSGIRWGSGLARQFQYEQSQSRIGGSLWEKRDLYIENSPVFFADRINTPLLIIFGDEDGAVPWYQGIELYLAMRRLGKDCIFLQYRGEPHHPQKYPNKLDWFKRMKEYFDYYLKGTTGPDWIRKGVPYRGK